MTEPETPGSDPTQLRTRAVRDGDGYVLNGHKWFTSNGSIADFLIVMAVTDPDARAAPARLDVHRPGRHARRADRPRRAERWSIRTSASACSAATPRSSTRTSRLPPEALLGGEGDGFLIAQHRLVPGRIHHCMRWLGVARRAFDMMCERSLYRPVRGGLLRDKQTVQNWIADSAAEMQAARLMTLHAAWKIDQYGSSAARDGRVADQVLRREGAARRRRPRAAGRTAGSATRRDMPLECCTASPGMRASSTAPTRCIASRSHGRSCARYDAPEDGIPTEYVPTRREAARRKFAHVLEQAPA